MNIKTVIATAVLALGSLGANAAQTTPVFVQGSFSDVLLGNIILGGSSNVGGTASYVTSYNLFGTDFTLPAVTFSSVSLYLNGLSVGTASSNAFTFSNLGAGTYSLKASGSVNGFNYIAAQYQVTPVPEPETFAMLLAGLGVMGAIARRRKTAAAV
ncbi:FxDxF family PEP-CTERM protein [Rhodoferax sp.]|uniref:FxDxF family PEP-CTERM protein n=1 Tax=Rhodoferax sp. TaxID=50421 RepID=UPI002ACD47BE|nr:FxDxF family PEP-CTERM protein [Rhodoferax sp.]MDZ7919075.1 FxDxF family PEP-CTERM protein [Rhodoferax sp.]